MNKRVLLLGSGGMLGSCVKKYLNFCPITIDLCCPTNRFDQQHRGEYERLITNGNFDYIVNCVGAIPQKTNDFSINWELPEFLASQIVGTNTKVIHASTDCEFSGKIPDGKMYSHTDKPDATDPYGLSKIRGTKVFSTSDFQATKQVIIFRTSIIGFEPNNGNKGLLGWFLSNEDGAVVTGFTNKWWNGITTLQWAKFCCLAILYNTKVICRGNCYNTNIFQPSTHPVNKYHLLNIFNEVFERNIHVRVGSKDKVERKILKSNWTGYIDNIYQQLVDLKGFYENDSKIF